MKDTNIALVKQPGSNTVARSDKDLVTLAKAGNPDAFQELVARCRNSCLRMATAILRSRDDAEDEVQNAFWKAYRNLQLFTEQSTFGTWVTRIVINHCLIRYRRTKRVEFVPYDGMSSDGDWYTAFEPSAKRASPEDNLGEEEVREKLRFELERIPVLLRLPVLLYYIDGNSLEEVAGRLGISVPATKSRLHRGQEYLRTRMLRHCGRRGLATLTRVA